MSLKDFTSELGSSMGAIGIFLYEKLLRRTSGSEAVSRSVLFSTVNGLSDKLMKAKLKPEMMMAVSTDTVSAVGSAAVAAIADAMTFSGKHAIAHGVVGAAGNLLGNWVGK